MHHPEGKQSLKHALERKTKILQGVCVLQAFCSWQLKKWETREYLCITFFFHLRTYFKWTWITQWTPLSIHLWDFQTGCSVEVQWNVVGTAEDGCFSRMLSNMMTTVDSSPNVHTYKAFVSCIQFCMQLTKAFAAETSCNQLIDWFCHVSAQDQFAFTEQRSNEPLRHYINWSDGKPANL